MPDFRNVTDLAKYISGSSQVLTQGNIGKILIQEANRLEQYIKEEINNYYASYAPKVYVRTFDWINSIRVSEPTLEGNNMSIRIYFDDSLAYHPSVISSDQPDGYVPWLLESGWDIRSKVGFSAPMFTHHPPTHYISNAVARYNTENKYGFKVTVETGYGEYNQSFLKG